jgi:hypothetical protein
MSYAFPTSVTFTVQSTGLHTQVGSASPVQFSAVAVHVGLRGLKGDKGDKGDTGDVNPQMPVLLAQAEQARDDAQAASAVAVPAALAAGASADEAADQAVIAATKAADAAASAAAAALFDPALYLPKSGNLDGLEDAAAARGNLGLGSAATRTALGSNGALYSRDSVLGPVSQAGGVPTGAIIESGSTANGIYIRFADGIQICWHNVAATVPGSGNLTLGWTYPAAFAGSVQARASWMAGNTGDIRGGFENAGLTSAGGFFINSSATARAGTGAFFAIGRWYV